MQTTIKTFYQLFLDSTGVSTDTRQIKRGNLFIALKGDNFNGNRFAKQALEKGAKYVVVSEESEGIKANNQNIFLVKDTLETLQHLAKHYRKTFDIPIIAVGGSNGKTTTKELIFSVLSQKFEAYATRGNLNNHIGLPLTLLGMPRSTDLAVIEMGANHEGEITELCEIAEPTHGIITNIGLDHLEGFGSMEGVARANSELYYFLMKKYPEGRNVFVNTNEEALVRLSAKLNNVLTYPNLGDYYQASLLPSAFFVKFETEKNEIVETQLFGNYNFSNITSALCIGKYFGVDSKQANQAVSNYTPKNNRSQVVEKNSNTILLDAYNANPSSMQSAIESFAKVEAQQKLVILGDMYELGESSEDEHRKLGAIVSKQGFDFVVFYGDLIKTAIASNPKAYYFSDKFSLHNWLKDKNFKNTHFLIKGSRGVALESVLEMI